MGWLVGKLMEAGEGSVLSPRVRKFKKVLCKMAKDLWRHRGELFAPNVKLRVGEKAVHRKLPRTTAQAEQEFRKLRRHGRRIRGITQVEEQVQRDRPAMMLIENLRNPKYMREIYGDLSSMAARFAQVKSFTPKEAKKLTKLQL